MSLRYKLGKARRLLASLSADEKAALRQICENIRQAQETMLANARPAMQQCLHRCEGLCCRNARVDDIIGLMDLVYILTLTPEFEETMTVRVAREKPFYSADCMFLKTDGGPCIFTSAVRPEVCITTFCSGDQGIQKEIQAIKRQFVKLNWFFLRRKPQAVCRALKSIFKSNGSRRRDPVRSDQASRRLKKERGTYREKQN
jgi:hypothetical protein